MGEEKKKVSEMTFKEFIEEAKKQGREKEAIEISYWIAKILGDEGFSEEQINKLKMQRVWDILLMFIGEDFERFFTLLYKLFGKEGMSHE